MGALRKKHIEIAAALRAAMKARTGDEVAPHQGARFHIMCYRYEWRLFRISRGINDGTRPHAPRCAARTTPKPPAKAKSETV